MYQIRINQREVLTVYSYITEQSIRGYVPYAIVRINFGNLRKKRVHICTQGRGKYLRIRKRRVYI